MHYSYVTNDWISSETLWSSIYRLALFFFPPPTFPLSLCCGCDYCDGWQMSGAVGAQWRQHLKQDCKCCWLTHFPDVSVMVIISVTAEAGVNEPVCNNSDVFWHLIKWAGSSAAMVKVYLILNIDARAHWLLQANYFTAMVASGALQHNSLKVRR